MDEIVQTCNRWFGLFGATVVRELIDAGCKQLVIDQVIAAALEIASNLLK